MIGMNRSTMAMALATALCGSAGMARAAITYTLSATDTNLTNWTFGAPVDSITQVSDLGAFDKRVDLGRSNNNSNLLRMAQTFQVSSTFTIDSVKLIVQSIAPNTNIHFRIFSVADVAAWTAYPLNPANVLVSGTYTTGTTAVYGMNILTIGLTGSDQATLAATTNGAGYAMELSVDAVSTNGLLQWQATINNTIAGLPLTYNTSGTSSTYSTGRDYAMAITAATVPEPLSLAMLAGSGFAALLIRKRR